MTIKEDVYTLLGVGVKNDTQSVKVTLNQGGLTKKLMKIVEMLDINNNITPVATIPSGTEDYGTTSDKTWEYDSVVGMLIYIYRNYRPYIQFAVYQCARFTHNPRRIHADTVKRICRYLYETQVQGLTFDPNSNMELESYLDTYFQDFGKMRTTKILCV